MESTTMQQFNHGRRARTILGPLALGAMVVRGGPASAAHAAGTPDFKTALEAKSWSVGAGDMAYFTAFYSRKTADNGPATVTLYLQKGFGSPTILNAQGFNCTKSYQAGGWFPGWYVTCSKPSIAPNGAWFDAIQVKATAPSAAGDYLVISGIDPAAGSDPDPSDNRADNKLHVS
jgi:hypothetical protein